MSNTCCADPGAEARNSIGIVLVTGMIVGTLFTLFVVPVFYTLIAADHRAQSAAADVEVSRTAAPNEVPA